MPDMLSMTAIQFSHPVIISVLMKTHYFLSAHGIFLYSGKQPELQCREHETLDHSICHLNEFQPAVKKDKQTDLGWPSPDTDEIMMVQETMQVLGLYKGAIDGIAGTDTLSAIRIYKKRVHLAPDNRISREFIEHLRHET